MIFAFLMWISINMNYEYTVIKEIPVVLENMKDGQALRYPVPKYLTVWFHGTGWQIASVYLSPNVKYYIDGSSIGQELYVVTTKELPEHVKLPSGVQVENARPDSIALALDAYIEKRVPIVPHLVITNRDGYGQIGSVQLQPDSVEISGSKSLIDTVEEWPTESRKFDDRHAPISEEIALETPQTFSVDLAPTTTNVKVDIEHVAERTISGVPVSVIGAPAGREVIFIPPKMDIIVRGGIDQLAKLSSGDFRAMVEYPTLTQDSSGIVQPILSAPPEVKVLRKTPEKFQFVIRKRL